MIDDSGDFESDSPDSEQWRWVPGYEGWYEVSDRANVRSVTRVVTDCNGVGHVRRGKMLKRCKGEVMLGRNGSRRYYNAASLKAWAFGESDEPKHGEGTRRAEFSTRRKQTAYSGIDGDSGRIEIAVTIRVRL